MMQRADRANQQRGDGGRNFHLSTYERAGGADLLQDQERGEERMTICSNFDRNYSRPESAEGVSIAGSGCSMLCAELYGYKMNG